MNQYKLKTIRVFLFAIFALTLFSCEKAVFDDEPTSEANANVILRVSSLEQIPFNTNDTRAQQDITELCTRLNFVIFDSQGNKVKTLAQKESDSSFGTASFTLDEGSYQLVIIAHNSDGTATVTAADKITFPNNIVSDTFYYYGTLVVGSEAQTHDLQLRRAVSMFRLTLTAPLSSAVHKLKFYYTGGSSTFSAVSGYGCVQSRQTVTLTVGSGQQTFDVFTFPHEESDVLKMTITALDAQDNAIDERVFEEVPVTRNQITRYTGNLFGGSGNGSGNENTSNIRMTADGEWAATNTSQF